jgi:nucleoid DNA-binding protein
VNRTGLVLAIARQCDFPQDVADLLVASITATIIEATDEGERVDVFGLGHFSVRARAERRARDHNGDTIVHLPSRTMVFKPDAAFRSRLNPRPVTSIRRPGGNGELMPLPKSQRSEQLGRPQRRHEQLGIDEQLLKDATRHLTAATADGPLTWSGRDAAVAGRFDMSIPDLHLASRALLGPGRLTTKEIAVVRQVACGPRPAATSAAASKPTRREVIALRSNDVVYVTTSRRAGAFHSRPDCPLLERGQAAAATMRKEVWPVEAVRQPRAELQGHLPCTFCVASIGSARLVRSSSGVGKAHRGPTTTKSSHVRHAAQAMSKGVAKRERARVEAARLGISVEELKARRRAQHEKASAEHQRR